MPYRSLPAKQAACLSALCGAERKASNTAPSAWLISQEQFDRYLRLTPPAEGQPGTVLFRFKKELGEAASALAAQTPITSALDSTRGLLRFTISHYIQNLNNAILRGKVLRETRTVYQLPIGSDLVPALITDDDLLLWAGRLEAGETARVAGGGPPMAWPGIAEVTELKDELISRSNIQSSAKDKTDEEQSDVGAMMPEVLAAITDLWDTIEFNLRHEPTNASRRRRAREWGVYYALRPGEEEEPAAPAAGAAAVNPNPAP